MKLENPEDYVLAGFEKSHLPTKKYNAIMVNKKTKKEKRVPFGDSRYQQYKDSTGLGLYSKLDHGDRKRRDAYRTRHQGEDTHKYSSGWFSWHFLW